MWNIETKSLSNGNKLDADEEHILFDYQPLTKQSNFYTLKDIPTEWLSNNFDSTKTANSRCCHLRLTSCHHV